MRSEARGEGRKKVERKKEAKSRQKESGAQVSQATVTGQGLSRFDNRDNQVDNIGQEISSLKTDLSSGRKIVETLADCLLAIGNAKRLEIAQFCLRPRKFTDIVVNLKMNPASFKFHSQVLIDCDLIEKVDRGVYRTTELGQRLLELVEKAAVIKG